MIFSLKDLFLKHFNWLEKWIISQGFKPIDTPNWISFQTVLDGSYKAVFACLFVCVFVLVYQKINLFRCQRVYIVCSLNLLQFQSYALQHFEEEQNTRSSPNDHHQECV
jgi:hypothetical protein